VTCSSTGAIGFSTASASSGGFHAIHHSAEHLDWLRRPPRAPIDTIYTMGLINLRRSCWVSPIQTLALLVAFRGIWAIYIHSKRTPALRPPAPADAARLSCTIGTTTATATPAITPISRP
jgi:hypothetical protein